MVYKEGERHKPVMLGECMEALRIKPDGVYVDCTLGAGGHSEEILKRLGSGRLIGIDKDGDELAVTSSRLKWRYGEKFITVHGDYEDLNEILDGLGIGDVDGVLADLGVSSMQLNDKDRGFAYMSDADLDMRMDREKSFSAYDVVNGYSVDELRRIIREYGEERYAGVIAANIVKERQKAPVRTTKQLVDIIERSVPTAWKRSGGHPAKRTFQAVRIEVNGELRNLGQAVTDMVMRLKAGGRIAVITFHSLEDRIVKQTFSYLERACVCEPGTPVCICGKISEVKVVTKKPCLPREDEISENSRAASAKLRVAERKGH